MNQRPVGEAKVRDFVAEIAGEDMHAKRVTSLSFAVLGLMHSAALAVHAIGLGLAQARGLDRKHTTKQVDRLLSNVGLDVWSFFARWVPFIVGGRKEIVVALDWTDFENDDHATVCLYLITERSRATPLIWMTGQKSEMRGWQRKFEEDVLQRLHDALPADVHVTILGDRAFGDVELYDFLRDLGFAFVIRFRGVVVVESANEEIGPASGWTPGNGRPLQLRSARVTRARYELGSFVTVQKPRMKDAWHLAVSDPHMSAANAVKLYARRFTIEEAFRDTKDPRFGWGLSATHVLNADRRDRLLLIAALAHELLSLLGTAGEQVGLDRTLKVNTVKRRTHSLLTQGWSYYLLLPNMKPERAEPLLRRFAELLKREPALDLLQAAA
jgi:Transposase DDE domain